MWSALVLLLALADPQQAGVAVARDRVVCLEYPGPPLPAGQKLMLLVPAEPEVAAVVAGPAPASCKPLEPAWTHYELRLISGGLTPDRPAIAIKSSQASLQAKECASTEGLHLTLWAGKPLSSRRVWHHYFYLGYDVQSNCTPGETRP